MIVVSTPEQRPEQGDLLVGWRQPVDSACQRRAKI
jgi:hypothetical protein